MKKKNKDREEFRGKNGGIGIKRGKREEKRKKGRKEEKGKKRGKREKGGEKREEKKGMLYKREKISSFCF